MTWKEIQRGGEFSDLRQWQNESTGQIASGEAPPATISTAQGPDDKWIKAEWHEGDGDSVHSVSGWRNIKTGDQTTTQPGGEILKDLGFVKEEDRGFSGSVWQDSAGKYYLNGEPTNLPNAEIEGALQNAAVVNQQHRASRNFGNFMDDNLLTFGLIAFGGAALMSGALSGVAAGVGAGETVAAGGMSTAAFPAASALETAVGGAANMSLIPGSLSTAASASPAWLTAAQAADAGGVAGAVTGGETTAAAPAAVTPAAESTIPKWLVNAGKGAVKGGIISGAMGGDPIKGALTGATAGVLGPMFSDAFPGGRFVGEIVTGIGTGVIANALSPNDKAATVAAGAGGAVDVDAAAKTFGTFGSIMLPSLFKPGIGPDYRGAAGI